MEEREGGEVKAEVGQLFDIGYQGVKVVDLARWAKVNNAVIVDARFSPASANPDFRKSSLMRAMPGRYVHVQAFGNANYKSDGPTQLVDGQRGLSVIKSLLEDRNVVVMCACWKYNECHRKDVIELIEATMGLTSTHLNPRDVRAPDAPPPPPEQGSLL